MSGLENLPPEVLRMILVWVDADSLMQLSRVSSTLHEQALKPEVWKERLEEVAGAGQWGRDPSGYLELLRQHRFSKVEYFAIAGTEAVTAVLWDQLVVEMEGRGAAEGLASRSKATSDSSLPPRLLAWWSVLTVWTSEDAGL